jgi:hypothetical protein
VGEIRKTLHRAAGDLRLEVHGVGRDPQRARHMGRAEFFGQKGNGVDGNGAWWYLVDVPGQGGNLTTGGKPINYNILE